MIRTGGENVYAAEVERVLLEHPAVLEAAVVGLPDERWDERVVAVVVPRPGATIEPDDVRAFCRERLAAYKVPKQVEVVADAAEDGPRQDRQARAAVLVDGKVPRGREPSDGVMKVRPGAQPGSGCTRVPGCAPSRTGRVAARAGSDAGR